MKTILAAFLAATALTAAAPARAQDTGADVAAELAAMRAQIASLEAKVKELEGAKAAEVPSWKGAPQFSDKENGWSFKPRGRLQIDAGWVGSPDGYDDRGLGFATEVRRARLGVEGTVPGGFGYKFEVDFADNDAEIVDAILTYDFSDEAGLVIGQHNPFQSLEELTSSRFTSFMERAAFTDAFNFERRVGVSLGYEKGPFLANVGIFSDNLGDLSTDENDSRSIDARAVYAPKLGDAQLHVGGSAHFRDNGDLPDLDIDTRYRQRPFLHTTDTRFLATPSLAVGKEQHYGLEAALIRGPWHGAAEVHWLKANRIDEASDPTFFGGYAEIGYYLTGETRGYKGGQFDRTKVRNPLSRGGAGAFQLNLRYDYLDLVDAGIVGGRQSGYEASLIWIPEDHVRFLLNYGHLRYEDAAVMPANGDSDFGINVLGARAQVDF